MSLGVVLVVSIILIGIFSVVLRPKVSEQTEAVASKSVSSQIQAGGAIVAQNQATLHFQTAGKLTYLPFKEGDAVSIGQTIASLDTTILQKQLTQALNTYRSTRDTFDQTVQNQDSHVIQRQQSTTTGESNTNYLNDVAKRIVDQNQANLDNSVLNVEIAQQALSLSVLTSPITGVITHMDVTTPGVNVLPTTTFTVADPSSVVFRADVSESYIDYVTEGGRVKIKLGNGNGKPIIGTVSKIYPDKVTLATGEKVYEVDIESTDFGQYGKLGQTGSALIDSNVESTARLVPTWTVLNHDSVWVVSDGTTQLRHVQVGKTHGDMIEILSGLEDGDQVVTSPEAIVAKTYRIL